MKTKRDLIQWTPENVVKMTTMWLAGKTAGQIAIALGDPRARHAVLGKINRMKLNRNLPPPAPKMKRLPVSLPPLPINRPAWEPLPGTQPVPLEARTGCRWPIGADSPFAFCNAPTDRAYCQAHEYLSTKRI